MGGHGYWERLVQDVVRIEPGERVLDLGCGPARVIDHLPSGVVYTGLDRNGRCVRQARRRYGDMASFIESDAAALHELTGEFDVIFAMGLLHHLSDPDACAMLSGAARLLVPGGRLMTADAVSTPQALPSAAWLLARDRGDYVRDVSGYRRLIAGSFKDIDLTLAMDLLRVPLTGAPFPLLIAMASVASRPRFVDAVEARPGRQPALAHG